MKQKLKDIIKPLLIAIIPSVIFIALCVYSDAYCSKHRATYEFTVTDKWQDTHGGFLKGTSTAYNITVSVKKIKKEGKYVHEQPYETIQTKRVSHGFYNRHELGSKWEGESPHLFMYDR